MVGVGWLGGDAESARLLPCLSGKINTQSIICAFTRWCCSYDQGFALREKGPPGGLSSSSLRVWPGGPAGRAGRLTDPVRACVPVSCRGSRRGQLIPLFYGAGGGALRINNRVLSLEMSANVPGERPPGPSCAALVTEVNK